MFFDEALPSSEFFKSQGGPQGSSGTSLRPREARGTKAFWSSGRRSEASLQRARRKRFERFNIIAARSVISSAPSPEKCPWLFLLHNFHELTPG